MARPRSNRGFYEEYKRDVHDGPRGNEQHNRPVLIQHGFRMAVWSVFTKLFAAIFYVMVLLLSSTGLTTLMYKPLRDMLIEIFTKTIFGS